MTKLIRFNIEDQSKGRSITTVNDENISFEYPCKSKTDCSPYHLVFSPGKFLIELWGAQGGSYEDITGGKGGYASGLLNIYRQTDAYLYLGGSNNFTSNLIVQEGGYNGGGNGFNNCSFPTFFGCGGGGGTDLRLSEDNLYRRIIVAGGGGGCGYNIQNKAGYGGGENGGDGYVKLSEEQNKHYGCLIQGGTQITGGSTSLYKPSSQNANRLFYSFANIGNGCSFYKTDGSGWSSGGGGGGYFGGACGCVFGGGGAGGSGFVFSEKYPQHSSMHIPYKYKLSEPILENGNSTKGNFGDGKALITIISYFPDVYRITCHCSKINFFKIQQLIVIIINIS